MAHANNDRPDTIGRQDLLDYFSIPEDQDAFELQDDQNSQNDSDTFELQDDQDLHDDEANFLRLSNPEPFDIFRINRTSATQEEICEAYEVRFLLHISKFRQDLRGETDYHEFIQQSGGSPDWHRIVARLVANLSVTVGTLQCYLLSALQEALEQNAKSRELSEISRSSIDTIVEIASQRNKQFYNPLVDQINALENHFPEKNYTEYPAKYAEFPESRGPGIRGAECYICKDTMGEGSPTTTHADGKCKNTFCKGCLTTWVKFCTSDKPTCPTCREPLKERRLASYLVVDPEEEEEQQQDGQMTTLCSLMSALT
jgi:hypothetical protein